MQCQNRTSLTSPQSAVRHEAGKLWIKTAEGEGLERSTIEYYRGHLDLHIKPLLGAVKLSQLTAPMVRTFQDNLRDGNRSRAMVRKAIGSLTAILADAQERGLVAQNVAQQRSRRRRRKDRRADKREKGRLKVGIHIPSPDEIRELLPHLTDRWRPLILTAIFTGLRASELRGLRWNSRR
jgi:integrase